MPRASIFTGQYRFPPSGYDALAAPYPSGPSREVNATTGPISIAVVIDFGAIFDINDRFQIFRTDLTVKPDGLTCALILHVFHEFRIFLITI